MFLLGFHQGDWGDLRRNARTAGGHLFERPYMNMRRIAAAASLATGAALALAPFASADITGIDPTTVVDSEISAENSLFQLEALLAGDSHDVTLATAPGAFDTISASDIPTTAANGAPTPLEYELYGVNPLEAGISGDTGPYSEFNGALTEFYNAYNVELYSFFNGGTLDTNTADYIENSSLNHALGLANTTEAAQYLYNFGVGDLKGFFGDFGTSSASAGAATDPLTSLVNGEVSSANSLFDLEAKIAGDSADIIHNTGTFDTIPLTDAPLNGTGTLDSLLYGVNPLEAGPSGDPGAYDVFNGALVKFDDAINVGVYALENGGNMLPAADFGTDLFGVSGTLATTLANDTASQAITDLLGNAVGDLHGFFGDFGTAMASLF